MTEDVAKPITPAPPPTPQQTVITSPVVVRVVEAPPADSLQWWGLIIIPLALALATGGLIFPRFCGPVIFPRFCGPVV
jgi:hypothetical protein